MSAIALTPRTMPVGLANGRRSIVPKETPSAVDATLPVAEQENSPIHPSFPGSALSKFLLNGLPGSREVCRRTSAGRKPFLA